MLNSSKSLVLFLEKEGIVMDQNLWEEMMLNGLDSDMEYIPFKEGRYICRTELKSLLYKFGLNKKNNIIEFHINTNPGDGYYFESKNGDGEALNVGLFDSTALTTFVLGKNGKYHSVGGVNVLLKICKSKVEWNFDLAKLIINNKIDGVKQVLV